MCMRNVLTNCCTKGSRKHSSPQRSELLRRESLHETYWHESNTLKCTMEGYKHMHSTLRKHRYFRCKHSSEFMRRESFHETHWHVSNTLASYHGGLNKHMHSTAASLFVMQAHVICSCGPCHPQSIGYRMMVCQGTHVTRVDPQLYSA